MLLRTKKLTAIRDWGLRSAKGTSIKNDMLAVVRKLAVIVYCVSIDGGEFIFAKVTPVIEKRILIGTITD